LPNTLTADGRVNTTPQSRALSLVVAGAGAVIVVGVSQTWISASSGIFTLERSGFDTGDGKLLAWIGAGIVLAGLLAAFVATRAWLVIATLGGLGGVATGVADYQDVTSRGSDTVSVSVGFGLYLCIVCAVLAVVFGMLGMKGHAEVSGRPATFLPSRSPGPFAPPSPPSP
jgi:hypothetical protein